MKPLSRRMLLRGAGGAALGLPLLEAMGCARPAEPAATKRQALEIPKRLVIFFTPNGTLLEKWRPRGGETDFTLQGILEPLARFRNHLLLLDGIDYQSHLLDARANMHDRGTGHLLTAQNLVPGQQGYDVFGHLYDGTAGGRSADQLIADQICGPTRFKSLQIGVDVGFDARQCFNYISYRGQFQPLAPENDPGFLFDRLFSVQGDLRSLVRRRLIADATLDQYKALSAKLGTEDKKRLELHVSSLQEVSRRAQNASEQRVCAPGGRPSAGSVPQQGEAQMDTLVAALSCDLSRVATLQWDSAAGDRTFPWLNISEAHHELSHAGDSDADAMDKIYRIERWYAEQFALLLSKLEAVPEGAGTLLDSTTVVWMNELSRGNNHDTVDAPIVIAGNLQGTFRTGRYLTWNATKPHNDFLVTLMRAYGVEVTRFGNPDCSNGPLEGLV